MANFGAALYSAGNKLARSGDVEPRQIFFAKAMGSESATQLRDARLPEAGRSLTLLSKDGSLVIADGEARAVLQDSRFSVLVAATISCNFIAHKLEVMGVNLRRMNTQFMDIALSPIEGALPAVEVARTGLALNTGGTSLPIDVSLIASNVTPKGGRVLWVIPVTSGDITLVVGTKSYPGSSFIPPEDKKILSSLDEPPNLLTSGLGASIRHWVGSVARNVEQAITTIIGEGTIIYQETFLRVEKSTPFNGQPQGALATRGAS